MLKRSASYLDINKRIRYESLNSAAVSAPALVTPAPVAAPAPAKPKRYIKSVSTPENQLGGQPISYKTYIR